MARTGAGDGELRVIRLAAGHVVQRHRLPRRGRRRQLHRLLLAGAIAPRQRDRNDRAGRAAENDMAGVRRAPGHAEAALADAADVRAIQRHHHVLRADIGMVAGHRHRGDVADRSPLAQRRQRRSVGSGRLYGIVRGIHHGEIELAVVEHFGPQGARHQTADRLDEHAVFVARHRLVLPIDMDLRLHRLGSGGAERQHGDHTGGQQHPDSKLPHHPFPFDVLSAPRRGRYQSGITTARSTEKRASRVATPVSGWPEPSLTV